MKDSPHQVFLCYASEDKHRVKNIIDILRRYGIKIWVDYEQLLPGQRWEFAIRQAIENSSFFLALLSSNSVQKGGYLQEEIKLAIKILDDLPESDIFIVPVRLDDCKPKIPNIDKIHMVNLFPNFEEGIQQILRVLLPEKSYQLVFGTKMRTQFQKDFLILLMHAESDFNFIKGKNIRISDKSWKYYETSFILESCSNPLIREVPQKESIYECEIIANSKNFENVSKQLNEKVALLREAIPITWKINIKNESKEWEHRINASSPCGRYVVKSYIIPRIDNSFDACLSITGKLRS